MCHQENIIIHHHQVSSLYCVLRTKYTHIYNSRENETGEREKLDIIA